jgi:hypothetical protein
MLTASAMLIADPTISIAAFFFCSPVFAPNSASVPWTTPGINAIDLRNSFKKFISISPYSAIHLPPKIINRQMKDRQHPTGSSYQPLHALHAPLMPFHPLLKLRQTSRLPNPEQLVHLILQHTQIRDYNSLAPYRAHQPTLYAVRCGAALLLRFVNFDEGRLILRPWSRDFPIQLLPLATHETPADYIVGRVCLVFSEL